MSAHERPVGATVEWYTPPELFARLGATFDLDPAASFGAPWVPARQFIVKADDGLAGPWAGHVWLNPPYGPAAAAFVDRMIQHGDGLLLLPSRTETIAYQRCLDAATTTCFLRDRLHFIRNDGFQARSSFGSTLFAFGSWAANVLVQADLGHTTTDWLVRDIALHRVEDAIRALPTLPPGRDGRIGAFEFGVWYRRQFLAAIDAARR